MTRLSRCFDELYRGAQERRIYNGYIREPTKGRDRWAKDRRLTERECTGEGGSAMEASTDPQRDDRRMGAYILRLDI